MHTETEKKESSALRDLSKKAGRFCGKVAKFEDRERAEEEDGVAVKVVGNLVKGISAVSDIAVKLAKSSFVKKEETPAPAEEAVEGEAAAEAPEEETFAEEAVEGEAAAEAPEEETFAEEAVEGETAAEAPEEETFAEEAVEGEAAAEAPEEEAVAEEAVEGEAAAEASKEEAVAEEAAAEVPEEEAAEEPEPEKYSRYELEKKTKTQLMELAKKLDVPDAALWRPKDDLVDRILAKQGKNEEESD